MTDRPAVEVRGPHGVITVPLELLRRKPLSEVGVFLTHLLGVVDGAPYTTLLEMPTILPCADRFPH